MHSSLKIADHFLKIAHEQGKTLTPMQLLKLVYMAHGWMLALYNRKLISDAVLAWKYGPVIRELYHQVKVYRNSPVERINPAWFKSEGKEELDELELDIIEQVFDKYGNWSGPQLSTLTHQKGTPWDKVRKQNDLDNPIPNSMIRDHYEKLTQKFASND